jgi:hypothetical protein
VIVGSAAAALIGLQFVVITLIANIAIGPNQDQASSAFATPTIIHFSVVLLVAGILTAPWRGIGAVTVICGLVGLAGIVYEIVVARTMRVQKAYVPVFEDWLFHFLLPLIAYATMAVSAFVARSNLDEALFGLGAAVMLLLFIGIHNAWDAVIYHVFTKRQGGKS